MKVKEILKDSSKWLPGTDYEYSNPFVSVVLPTFKRAKSGLFEKAVQSVLNQNLKNIELIIIDDCSTDGTFDLIQYFMKVDPRVSCIRHSYNIGLPAISEYEGYVKAKGEYIAFVFDDNEWDKNYLEKTISYMVRSKVKATYGIIWSYYGEGPHEYIELGNPNCSTTSLCDLLATNFIANCGVVLHRTVIEDVGLYDPHVSLTRLCDWDLWIRIMQKYCFEGTGIFAGCEYGAKLKDSLGNTVKMSLWCSIEQMRLNRNVALMPKNFLNYDIFATIPTNTDLFIDNTYIFSNQYIKKQWFNKEDESLRNNRLNIVKAKKKKRIAVLTNCLDATTTLSFARLFIDNDDIIFRFGTINTFHKSELIYADAMICIRNIQALKPYLKVCEEFGIPCYYYIDDNFIELSKDYKKDFILSKLAKEINYNSLKKFDGIFVSTQALLDYFRDKKLHENLLLMEPIIDIRNIQGFPKNKDNDNFTIAFMGGSIRMKVFQQIVLPALERLATIRHITVFYPEQKENYIERDNQIYKNLELVEIPKSLSLDLTLFRYGAKKPDILIHCGPDIKNNVYKTENSLINAVQIGAVLVSSNIPPYRGQDNEKQRFVLAENTEISWYEVLKSLIENPAKCKEIYENALEYCIKRYCPAKIKKVVNQELTKVQNTSYPQMLKRYDEMLFDLLYYRNRLNEYEGNETKLFRSLTEVPLSLSKLIPNKTSYKIRCMVDNFSELGLCFACYGECAGYVKIRIYDGKNQIREVKLNLDDFVRDFWTYVQFDPIKHSMNKVYIIALEFIYEQGSSYVGVFEDSTRRTFIYKVMNKLGYHMKGMNVLFADCRS